MSDTDSADDAETAEDAGSEDDTTPALDAEALASYLERELGPAEAVTIEGEGGGYSNETLFIRWGTRDLVLRRPPPDETADSAHDVLREYRIVDALQDTAVPVATTVCACADESVLGTEFYVMERLDGEVVHTEEPDRFATPASRTRLAEAFVDALAAVHRVEYEAVGLGELGHPAGYLDRQVERFSQAIAWASDTTAEERAVPALGEVGDWLADNVPEASAHALVHGDYKLDNVMFGPGRSPEIVGVFDWEMSTLGDPLADVGYALHFWPDPDEREDERVVTERFAPRFLAREDYPTRREFVARYEAQSGTAFENRTFYLALAAYKMAALGEMFYARYLRGGVSDPMYAAMGEGVPTQAERAVEIIEGEWTI